MAEQARVVDAQRGGIIGVSAHKLADEPITIAGRQVQATRYTFITPYYLWQRLVRPGKSLGARRIRA
jgi:hypothetical protein